MDDLIEIFNQLFQKTYLTVLEGGGDEPFYRAARALDEPARLIFREDFYASALHEIAHWCIAGEKRRRLDDFGYWYVPAGRSQAEQNAFYHVEVKPQALEAVFTFAAGRPFKPSTDNIGHSLGEAEAFTTAVQQQIPQYLKNLPKRAKQFSDALIAFYQPYAELA